MPENRAVLSDHWKCDECGRTFATRDGAAGHIDPRPAADGYRFCAGTAIRIVSDVREALNGGETT